MSKRLRFFLGIFFWIGLFHYSSGQTNTFPSSGNVGIGTTSPSYPLHMYSSGNTRVRFQFGSRNIDLVSYGAGTKAYSDAHGIFLTGQTGFIMTGIDSDLVFITNNSDYAERMRILANGKIGIGTQSPQFLLSVKGTIGAQEVNITTSGWADHVFEKEYQLKPLSEVEDFISTNGHLPNIPKESEVVQNGVNLLEMNIKLLEKVEELTLYLIEQQKEIEKLKSWLKENGQKVNER